MRDMLCLLMVVKLWMVPVLMALITVLLLRVTLLTGRG
jgi:hypothetical protein